MEGLLLKPGRRMMSKKRSSGNRRHDGNRWTDNEHTRVYTADDSVAWLRRRDGNNHGRWAMVRCGCI